MEFLQTASSPHHVKYLIEIHYPQHLLHKAWFLILILLIMENISAEGIHSHEIKIYSNNM